MLLNNFRINTKNIILGFVSLALISYSAYIFNDKFKARFELAVDEISHLEKAHKNSSVGVRLRFLQNSLVLIKDNFLLGVGTGDFPEEYKAVNSLLSPEMPIATNPHNMYIFVMSHLGAFGLIFFFLVFYSLYKSLDIDSPLYTNLGVGLIVFFIIINLSDSYLLGHFTSFLFVFFVSILYKNHEPN